MGRGRSANIAETTDRMECCRSSKAMGKTTPVGSISIIIKETYRLQNGAFLLARTLDEATQQGTVYVLLRTSRSAI
jgi:hypothetical protein